MGSLGCEYCVECEQQLNKFYNFMAKCHLAVKILQGEIKTSYPRKSIYLLLPQSPLALWNQKDMGLYQYKYSEETRNTANKFQPKSNEHQKLKINEINQQSLADVSTAYQLLVVPNIYTEELIPEKVILLQNIVDHNNLDKNNVRQIVDNTNKARQNTVESDIINTNKVVQNLCDTDDLMENIDYEVMQNIDASNGAIENVDESDEVFENIDYLEEAIEDIIYSNTFVKELIDPLLNEEEIKSEDEQDTFEEGIETHGVLNDFEGEVSEDFKEEVTDNYGKEITSNFKKEIIGDIENDIESLELPNNRTSNSGLNSGNSCNSDLFISNNRKNAIDIEEIKDIAIKKNARVIAANQTNITSNYTVETVNDINKTVNNINETVNQVEISNALKDHDYSMVLAELKTSTDKTSSVSISNEVFQNDDSKKYKELNSSQTKQRIIIITDKKGKVKKKRKKQKSYYAAFLAREEPSGVNVSLSRITKKCKALCKKTSAQFDKERLKAELTIKFAAYDELRTEDGTVIDKQCILDVIDDRPDDIHLRELWFDVNGNSTITNNALKLLKYIQTRYNKELESVFVIKYLNTKENILAEFEKRKQCASYTNAKYKCENCYLGFEHEKRYEYHMKKWHDMTAGNFVCSVCGSRCRRRKHLGIHMLRHRNVFKCKLCPLVTSYRTSMMNHYQQHRGVEYKCENCGGVFKSRSALNGHLARFCRKLESRRICSLCANLFVSKQGLEQHMNQKHKDAPPIDPSTSVTCYLCDLSFVTREVFDTHMRLSHPDQKPDKPRVQQIKETKPYRRKPRVLTNKRPVYKCPDCKKVGSSLAWLNQHFSIEHPGVDISSMYRNTHKFLCDLCGKGFKLKCKLHEHLNRHAGLRPFQCSRCPARFHRARALLTHGEVHEPPGRLCPHCGKTFRSKSNLNAHIRIHVGDRRFKCKICGKGFLLSSSLKEHVQGVHFNIRRERRGDAHRGQVIREGSRDQ